MHTTQYVYGVRTYTAMHRCLHVQRLNLLLWQYEIIPLMVCQKHIGSIYCASDSNFPGTE